MNPQEILAAGQRLSNNIDGIENYGHTGTLNKEVARDAALSIGLE